VVTIPAMSTVAVEILGPLRIDWPAELLRHGSWLRGVLLARSRDRQAVEELLQVVSAEAVEHRDGLRDESRVAPWLYRIAVRTALLHRRHLGRQRRLHDAVAEHRRQSADGAGTSPLDWLLSIERNQLVRQALSSLPSKEAELLVLKYTEDWSYRELSEHLGISEAAVESRLTRARGKLRAKLRGWNDE